MQSQTRTRKKEPYESEGNTILITGGGSGIGRGLAEAFHKLGNHVVITGRRRDVLDRTAAANPGMAAMVMDVSKAESIRAVAEEAIAKFPPLNIVVNNAGVQRVHDFAAGSLDENAMREEIDTNVYGVIRVSAAFLPHLKTRPRATIVNVSSGLAFLPLARYPVYCATKAFVHSFSMSMRHQLRHTNVRVVELAPPWVATDLDANHASPTEHDGMKPMPFTDFIAAAVEELSSDRDELPVAGAKFLYSAGLGEKSGVIFAQMNR